jgi:pantothenate kinase-related protein Tda10
MAGFEKPKPLKAALKMALYGPAGSGKSFTALLVAEGLARHTGKRVAYVDTDFGTAFYGQDVPQRAVHPRRSTSRSCIPSRSPRS